MFGKKKDPYVKSLESAISACDKVLSKKKPKRIKKYTKVLEEVPVTYEQSNTRVFLIHKAIHEKDLGAVQMLREIYQAKLNNIPPDRR